MPQTATWPAGPAARLGGTVGEEALGGRGPAGVEAAREIRCGPDLGLDDYLVPAVPGYAAAQGAPALAGIEDGGDGADAARGEGFEIGFVGVPADDVPGVEQ